MIVYVVKWWSWSYENGVSAVFSTEEKAKKWAEENEGKEVLVGGYTITEHEVDNPSWEG